MSQTADPDATEGRSRPSRTSDLVAGVLGLAAAALLVAAPQLVDRSGPDPFYKGPLIFPLIALAITVAGALPALVRLATAAGRSWFIDGNGVPLRAIALFALACFYAPAIAWAGLDAATFVFMLGGLLITNPRRPLRALVTAGAATVVLHLAFISFLDIWFPEPTAWSWLSGD
ncbi:tripartite tricarboxylate transporter TctB family protein [Amorphus coralli]|uniref:tripartite tricarboxylate transporter TctB family protein n=1 Tax=Amorphus coralli TaxID=340680 RepID=UPI00037546B4|nr:tripartite tricarboxylate transporter TctB family protein [Amorphus coralli]